MKFKHKFNEKVAIGSPIKVSAYNIDGLTIYRLFQLPISQNNNFACVKFVILWIKKMDGLAENTFSYLAI